MAHLAAIAKSVSPRVLGTAMKRCGHHCARRSMSSLIPRHVVVARAVPEARGPCGPRFYRSGGPPLARIPLRGLALRRGPWRADLMEPWLSDPRANLQSFDSMLSAMERMLLDEFPGTRFSLSQSRSHWEVRETDDSFVLRFDMPGLAKEDVSVRVEEGRLTVTGERKNEQRSDDARAALAQEAPAPAEASPQADAGVAADHRNDTTGSAAATGSEAAPLQSEAPQAEEPQDVAGGVAARQPQAAAEPLVERWQSGTLREFSSRKYSTVLSLPDNADVAGVQAKMEHGVLMVTVPKVREEKPPVVEIPVN